MRRRQQNRADRAISEHRVQIAGQLTMVLRAKASRRLDDGLDRTDDSQPLVAVRGRDEIAAPAAEADNRCADPLIPSVAGRRRRIASITAGLSLSGPSSAMAARNNSAWIVVIGKCRFCRPA